LKKVQFKFNIGGNTHLGSVYIWKGGLLGCAPSEAGPEYLEARLKY
jgi:hypothetical protein